MLYRCNLPSHCSITMPSRRSLYPNKRPVDIGMADWRSIGNSRNASNADFAVSLITCLSRLAKERGGWIFIVSFRQVPEKKEKAVS